MVFSSVTWATVVARMVKFYNLNRSFNWWKLWYGKNVQRAKLFQMLYTTNNYSGLPLKFMMFM